MIIKGLHMQKEGKLILLLFL